MCSEYFLADKEKRVPIQEIMSVPVMQGEKMKGVVQIATNCADHDNASADFSVVDLDLLTDLTAA